MITFRALGLPAPQGSKRAYIVGTRAVVVENNKHTQQSWRTAVADTAHQHRPDRDIARRQGQPGFFQGDGHPIRVLHGPSVPIPGRDGQVGISWGKLARSVAEVNSL